MKRVVTIVLFFILITHSFSDNALQQNSTNNLYIPFTKANITLDGNLDDPIWKEATKVESFSEFFPVSERKPFVKTEAFIAYNAENLYVAFICEADPNEMRASLTKRDNIYQDDFVGVLIDPYNNAATAYEFYSNPLGVQGDGSIRSNGGDDESFDYIYYTEAKITESGYQVEMIIPFSSIRFPDKEIQKWRFNFWRSVPRDHRYKFTWAPIRLGDPCFLCKFIETTPLKGIKAKNPIEVLPYISSSQASTRKNNTLQHGDIKGSFGGDIKWAITPSLTVEATINPDFSQIEADAGQIDVNETLGLSYPERRPFFQEGSDQFAPWFSIVYTRAINNPTIAGKVISRWENASLLYLTAHDENTPYRFALEEGQIQMGSNDESISNILRYKYDFGQSTYMGLTLSDRRYRDKAFITNYSIDGVYRFWEKYQIEYQLVGSYTKELNDTSLTGIDYEDYDQSDKNPAFDGESYNGDGVYASLERSAKHWSFDFDYWHVSPTYQTGNGFQRGTNSRRVTLSNDYRFYYDDHPILTQIRPRFRFRHGWNFAGDKKFEEYSADLKIEMTGQTEFTLFFNNKNERFGNKDFNGLNRYALFAKTTFSKEFSIGSYLRYGHNIHRRSLKKGYGVDVWDLFMELKPTGQLTIQPSFVYSELRLSENDKFAYKGYISRIKTTYQFTKELSTRIIVEYNNFRDNLLLEPLLSYQLNPFSVFYLGMSHGSERTVPEEDFFLSQFETQDRQFFMKFQYLFSL